MSHAVLCNGQFEEGCQKNGKVRDHDHRTGQYRGAAHANV